MNGNCEVLILAGDRGSGDPVAELRQVPGKVFAPVAGKPMLARVLEAVAACDGLGSIHLLGPDKALEAQLAPVIAPWRARITWHAPADGPSASVARALDAMPVDRGALLTSGDHALLRPEMVSDFLSGAQSTGAQVCVALVPWPLVAARFPGSRRTRYRFRDGQFCGANLFWFSGPAAKPVAELWRQVEADRKKPWRVARLLGLWNLVRFLTRRLTLEGAFAVLSHRLGMTIAPVVLNHAEAAVDVDNLNDLALAEQVLAERESALNGPLHRR